LSIIGINGSKQKVYCKDCEYFRKSRYEELHSYFCDFLGVIFNEQDVLLIKDYCEIFKPKIRSYSIKIDGLNKKEEELYNLLVNNPSGVIVLSLPPMYRGAIGGLLNRNLVSICYEWLCLYRSINKTNLLKKFKVVKVCQ
jgi:hypothetical protein